MTTLPSANYTRPRLAALYDALNPPGPADDFYLSLPGPAPQRILDVGCGTGWLAAALAAQGHEVTGADPAEAMLAVAQNRPGGGGVRWVRADAAGLPGAGLATTGPGTTGPGTTGPGTTGPGTTGPGTTGPGGFDLITLTGHVFQLLLGDEEVAAALGALARCLAPGGRLALETRNPLAREWEFWSPAQTRRTVPGPDGPVGVHYDIEAVTGDLVTYETWFAFPDGSTEVTADTLRFMRRAELARFLAGAGLAAEAWYGDWDRSPAGPSSPEIIVLARHARPPAARGVAGPEQSWEDTDAAWGEHPGPRDGERLRRDRPPHWG